LLHGGPMVTLGQFAGLRDIVWFTNQGIWRVSGICGLVSRFPCWGHL